jgi:hypothetical protein
MSGLVEFNPPPNATPEQIQQVRDYVAIGNDALAAGYLSPTGRVSTKGKLAVDAQALANAEGRRAATAGETTYDGKVVGHGLDTSWNNNPKPFKWIALDKIVNSSLAGQINRYPVGFKPTGFTVGPPKPKG